MATSKKNRFLQRPGVRVGVILSSIVIALALAAAGLWAVSKSLFSRNENFVVRRVVVRSGGWWRRHRREVEKTLGVIPGKTNLFEFSLPELRAKLAGRPSVESVEISRIIPDTLVVDINERVPMAFLYWSGNDKVVDRSGVVMSASSSFSVGDLPVVTGFKSQKKDLMPGGRLPKILPALRLLDLAARVVPAARITRISVYNPDYFKMEMRVEGTRRVFTLYMSKKDVAVKLRALKALLPKVLKSNPAATIIDMRFKGQALVK